MSRNKRFLSCIFLSLGAQCVVYAADLGPLLSGYVPGPAEDNGWSVFVGRNFETRDGVAELEGRGFVRGDFLVNRLVGNYHYVVGRAGAGSGVFPSAAVPHLVVGGSIRGSGGLNLVGRSIQVGTNISSAVSFIDLAGTVTGGVDYAAADTLISELQAKSRYWGSLTDTPGGSIVSQWGGVYVSADGANGNPQTWVFNLTFDVTTAFWGMQFEGFEEGDTILVNCNKAGADDTFVLGCQSYSINGINVRSPFAAKVLWNFPDAKTVEICNSAVLQGSVLIANAESVAKVSAASMDGRFITCGSAVHSGYTPPWGGVSGGREFHNYPFNGSLPELPIYSIRGSVRDDTDRNWTVSNPDVPISGATVSLYTDPNGDGDPSDGVLLQTTRTGKGGSYAFSNLVSSSYVVVGSVQGINGINAIPVVLDAGDSDDNDILEAIDPAGFFYESSSGLIVPGGTITVDGPGHLILMDGSEGQYMFVSTNTVEAVFTMTVTPPSGYKVDPSRPAQAGFFDPTGLPAPVVLGSARNAAQPEFLEDANAQANPYYLTFSLAPGDPQIINNNIPLVKTTTLSTALDISLYQSSEGVMIELWTENESGTEDIVVFAWLNNAWAEVGRVPSWEIAGDGTSNKYVVRAEGLAPDGAYLFKVLDESGHEHLSPLPVAVRTLRVEAVRLDLQTLTLAFNTEAGRPYVVKVSTDLVHWTTEYVSSPTAQGWSDYRNTPFTAGGVSTQVRVPVNGRKQAFFKIEMVE